MKYEIATPVSLGYVCRCLSLQFSLKTNTNTFESMTAILAIVYVSFAKKVETLFLISYLFVFPLTFWWEKNGGYPYSLVGPVRGFVTYVCSFSG